MKNNKLAFTLAEILITLSIIGVVAALLIPQLVDNTKKAQYGATLGRAVRQIELGISNLLNKANEKNGGIVTSLDLLNHNLTFIESDDETPLINDFVLFDNQLGLFDLAEVEGASDYLEKLNITVPQGGSTKIYKFNKFNAYLVYTAKPGEMIDGNDIFTVLAIDTNGATKPNKVGKDIFGFGITTSGKLVAAGTEKVNDYTSEYSTTMLGTVPLANTDEGCKDGSLKNPWSCTALVIKDGYRINF